MHALHGLLPVGYATKSNTSSADVAGRRRRPRKAASSWQYVRKRLGRGRVSTWCAACLVVLVSSLCSGAVLPVRTHARGRCWDTAQGLSDRGHGSKGMVLAQDPASRPREHWKLHPNRILSSPDARSLFVSVATVCRCPLRCCSGCCLRCETFATARWTAPSSTPSLHLRTVSPSSPRISSST